MREERAAFLWYYLKENGFNQKGSVLQGACSQHTGPTAVCIRARTPSVWPLEELVLVSVCEHLSPCSYCPSMFSRYFLNNTVSGMIKRSDYSTLAKRIQLYWTCRHLTLHNCCEKSYADTCIQISFWLSVLTLLHQVSFLDAQMFTVYSFHTSVLF